MRYVPYLYFLRIPLLFALVLPTLLLVGLWIGGEPNPMIGSFFDLSTACDQNACDDPVHALSSFLHSLHHPQWNSVLRFVR